MTSEKNISVQIKASMVQARVYAEHYDLQIAQTAKTIAECKRMQDVVNKEGRTITEEGKGGQKIVAHPLLSIINQYQRTILQQLSSLGLNRLKSSDPVSNNSAMSDFLSKIDG